MTEFFQQLWSAISSGDLQAILACITALATATYPFWGLAVKSYIEKVKAKYSTKSSEVTELLSALKISDAQYKALALESKKQVEAISKALEVLATNSSLTDETKQYVSKLLNSVSTNTAELIQSKIDALDTTEEEETKLVETQPTENTTETVDDTPVGL